MSADPVTERRCDEQATTDTNHLQRGEEGEQIDGGVAGEGHTDLRGALEDDAGAAGGQDRGLRGQERRGAQGEQHGRGKVGDAAATMENVLKEWEHLQ